MKKTHIILLAASIVVAIVVLLGFGLLNQDIPHACTADAKLCPDGSSVGRDPDNNCSFYPCPEDDIVYCQPDERNVGACIEIYQPVCGYFDPEEIVCVTAPCAVTFSNSCFACDDPTILYYTQGECEFA